MEENTETYGLTLEQLQALGKKVNVKVIDYLDYNTNITDTDEGRHAKPPITIGNYLKAHGFRDGDVFQFKLTRLPSGQWYNDAVWFGDTADGETPYMSTTYNIFYLHILNDYRSVISVLGADRELKTYHTYDENNRCISVDSFVTSTTKFGERGDMPGEEGALDGGAGTQIRDVIDIDGNIEGLGPIELEFDEDFSWMAPVDTIRADGPDGWNSKFDSQTDFDYSSWGEGEQKNIWVQSYTGAAYVGMVAWGDIYQNGQKVAEIQGSRSDIAPGNAMVQLLREGSTEEDQLPILKVVGFEEFSPKFAKPRTLATSAVKVLTTADYNWNSIAQTTTGALDSVALWLLEPGYYVWPESGVTINASADVKWSSEDSKGNMARVSAVRNGRKRITFISGERGNTAGTALPKAAIEISLDAVTGRNGNWEYPLYSSSIADNLDTTIYGAVLSAKQGKALNDKITPTSGSGAPTTATAGILGKIYIDTDTDTAYMCVKADTATPEYTWKQITA